MTASPHVLLVTVDHWPGSLLGVAGHPVAQTPTLDQLARAGRLYEQAYSECPVCIPARRTLLTGTTPRRHGDRTFQPELPFPDLESLPAAFARHGYQTAAVGKLHVYPPRARVGFEEVVLCEEGRPQYGPTDDYEIYLGDQGLVGEQFTHGMSNNDYVCRPWHLDERHHVTNWLTRQMARTIQRRDPTRPGFWYLSYTHPHPPLVPAATYWDLYRCLDVPLPYRGDWEPGASREMPRLMNERLIDSPRYSEELIRAARRAFYALCTQIDHQLRVVIGTLREEGLWDDTLFLFTSDHGDMLGNHGLWAKRLFYEDSARVPLILSGGRVARERFAVGMRDRRLAGLQDVMPTLCGLAEVPVPASVEGRSLVSDEPRGGLYGEYGVGWEATRMFHDGRYKLIYYAAGNRLQMFDLDNDPRELQDLSESAAHEPVRRRLVAQLRECLYGEDLSLLAEGQLAGVPVPDAEPDIDRTLSLQRGSHWPPPPPVRKE